MIGATWLWVNNYLPEMKHRYVEPGFRRSGGFILNHQPHVGSSLGHQARAAGKRPGRPGLGGGWRCAVGQAQEEAAGKVLEAQELAVNDLAKSSPGARADRFALVIFIYRYIYIY